MAFGVTTTGFKPKTQADIILDIETTARELWGDDFDVKGQFFAHNAAIVANEIAILWEAMSAAVFLVNGENAQDKWLDMICSLIGVFRNEASSTVIPVLGISGDDQIGNPSNLATPANLTGRYGLHDFTLDGDVLVTSTSCIKAWIEESSLATGTSLTIEVSGLTYTYVVQLDDTLAEVVDGFNAASSSDGLVEFSAEFYNDEDVTDPLNEKIVITSSNPEGFNMHISSLTNMSIYKVASKGAMTAEDTGPIEVPAYGVAIVSSPSWVDFIFNHDDARPGTDIQNDVELNLERKQSFSTSGGGTLDAIVSRLLKVQDVTAVGGAQNKSSQDFRPAGLPPHSYSLVVDGGTDLAVAQAILSHGPAGIECYAGEPGDPGFTSVTLPDIQGVDQVINFSRSVGTYIHFRITWYRHTEQSVTTDIDSVISKSVIDYAKEFTHLMGIDLVAEKYKGPIYSNTTGIISLDLEIANTTQSTDVPTNWTTSSLVIDSLEKPFFDETRVTVIEG